jgi:hypothetical protein
MALSPSEISSLILKCILSLICLYFLVTRLNRYFRHDRGQTLFKLVSSCFVWGSILLLTLIPSSAYNISETLGLGKNLNTLIFIGFVISFAVTFRLLRTIEQLESSISEIVSKLAVEKVQRVQHQDHHAQSEKETARITSKD